MTSSTFETALSIISLLTSFAFAPFIFIYPLRSYLRFTENTVKAWSLFLITTMAAIFYLSPGSRSNVGISMMLVCLALVGFILLALCALKNCLPQLLYSIFLGIGLGCVSIGICNYIDVVSNLPEPVVSLIRIVTASLLCMVCVRILTRLFDLWVQTCRGFWKTVWLIPLSLLIIAAFNGNIWQLKAGDHSFSFLISRLLLLISILSCDVLLETILRQQTHLCQIEKKEQQLLHYHHLQEDTMKKLAGQWIKSESVRQQQTELIQQIKSLARQKNHSAIDRILNEYASRSAESDPIMLCQNYAVNALANQYRYLAERERIPISFQLDIPQTPGNIQNVDLCRIFGNLLENAIEACLRMKQGQPKIAVSSIVAGQMLILVVDNNFDGDIYIKKGQYLSRKRESGIATGLSSVAAIAEKYHGQTSFQINNNVFKASVRLFMGSQMQ